MLRLATLANAFKHELVQLPPGVLLEDALAVLAEAVRLNSKIGMDGTVASLAAHRADLHADPDFSTLPLSGASSAKVLDAILDDPLIAKQAEKQPERQSVSSGGDAGAGGRKRRCMAREGGCDEGWDIFDVPGDSPRALRTCPVCQTQLRHRRGPVGVRGVRGDSGGDEDDGSSGYDSSDNPDYEFEEDADDGGTDAPVSLEDVYKAVTDVRFGMLATFFLGQVVTVASMVTVLGVVSWMSA